MDNSSLFFLITKHWLTWDKIVLLKNVHFGCKIEFKKEKKYCPKKNNKTAVFLKTRVFANPGAVTVKFAVLLLLFLLVLPFADALAVAVDIAVIRLLFMLLILLLLLLLLLHHHSFCLGWGWYRGVRWRKNGETDSVNPTVRGTHRTRDTFVSTVFKLSHLFSKVN